MLWLLLLAKQIVYVPWEFSEGAIATEVAICKHLSMVV